MQLETWPSGPVVVVIGMAKGGSGKTTTAMHVATALARAGRPVCVRDGDPTSQSAYDWMRVAAAAGDPLPFAVERFPYAEDIAAELARLRADGQDVVVDAGGGNPQLLEEACTEADVALVPLAPSAADARRLAATMTAIERGGARNGNERGLLVLTAIVRADHRTSEPAAWRAQLEADGHPVLDTTVGARVAYSRAYGTVPEPGEYGDLTAELGRELVGQPVTA